MTRLAVLALAAALLEGCAATGPAASPTDPPSATGGTTPSTTPSAAPSTSPPAPTPSVTPTAPPRPPQYTVPDDEVYPNAKQVAARIAQTVTTYDIGTRPADLSGDVTADPGRRDALDTGVAPLVDSTRWSRGRVVYPQLGGLTADRVSVMVVVEQRQGTGSDADRIATRTLDVRLVLTEGTWAFDELASTGGAPVPRPADLSQAAGAVLDDPRIELPDSARWDIHAGTVSEALLEMMQELAERTPYGVVTLSSGHPYDVFGTDRQSNHTRGRAVDVYRLGPTRVIDDRAPTSGTHEVVTWLYDRPGLSELGSPWALDGYGGRSFTDTVHQDHLHIGVGDRG